MANGTWSFSSVHLESKEGERGRKREGDERRQTEEDEGGKAEGEEEEVWA